jgi:hypothetical protein
LRCYNSKDYLGGEANMNFIQRIFVGIPFEAYILAAIAVVFVIALSALLLGQEIRWSQHGYWKRRNVPTKRPKPEGQTKGSGT